MRVKASRGIRGPGRFPLDRRGGQGGAWGLCMRRAQCSLNRRVC